MKERIKMDMNKKLHTTTFDVHVGVGKDDASGQVALLPENGTVIPGGIEAQTERCCLNLKTVLEAAGLDFDSVVKTTCFLADMVDFAAFNSVYERYFAGKPARSCVAVRELPKQALCEIGLIAATE